MKKSAFCTSLLFLLIFNSVMAQEAKKKTEEKKDPYNSSLFNALEFRCIGPSYMSGRIADIAVNPKNISEYYIAPASGGVWKTVNSGITWSALFDSQGSYSIADVELDPRNPNIIWVGTGENNSQRSVSYGDGVYKSEDGGKSWKNMGLKNSEHIGQITIDPRNSHVYVAAQGPLWSPGGERGLYKTIDGGKTWNRIYFISDNTGFNNIVLDPRNPDILYATSYQRRRHVFTLIHGGPESAVYKSTDAGATWTKLESGLPSGECGRIGLTISPVNPDVLYAVIEEKGAKSGFYKTTNQGASWTRVGDINISSPQYYHKLTADPVDVNKVYAIDTYTKVTKDGGKTFETVGLDNRHVDDHAIWINPDNTNHLLIGGDGGLYETYDAGANWLHKGNLPIIQFYRVAVDNTLPFYYVYGGTQDNNSVGGPSQTVCSDGIFNHDWFTTTGGDGFESQIDPENPNIAYAQSQYGGIVRYDKASGENIDIKPQPPVGEAYRWNWNSPLLVSAHVPKRLYFCANKVFKTDDRGNSWQVISPDLTRQIDRNKLPVMGKVQPIDAIAKNASTSLYGNITAFDESPKTKGLLFAGTDDGLIQITDNDGNTWTKVEKFAGIPDTTYVSFIKASQHDENVVYASFDNHKRGDFKPYLLKSTDKGKTWRSIVSNLPERGTVYSIAEDFISKDLLFAGTEFGIYFTNDGGKNWIQLTGGLPTIQIPDIAIQKRECDLVVATFGRSFWVLDDYSPLRLFTKENMQKKCVLFPVQDAYLYIQTSGKYGQGATVYKGDNPKFGATFTYYIPDTIKTLKEIRKAKEKELKNQTVPYPTWEQLQAEADEPAPYILFTITDANGNEVRKLTASPNNSISRITWDLRAESTSPLRLKSDNNRGVLVAPGKYTVQISKFLNGVFTKLSEPVTFNVLPLNNSTLPAENQEELAKFRKDAAELMRVVDGASKSLKELTDRVLYIKQAIKTTPGVPGSLFEQANKIHLQLNEISVKLDGNDIIAKNNENQTPCISDRLSICTYGLWESTSQPTQTMRDQLKIVREAIAPILESLKDINENGLKNLEKELDKAGVPWSPGRIPVLKN